MQARVLQPELMDDPALPAAEHTLALNTLARLNSISRTARTLWPCVLRVRAPTGPTSVLDVATGSGDVPVALARLAAHAHVPLDLHACDVSPIAVRAAANRFVAANIPPRVHVRDVVRLGLDWPDSSVDVVTCSLFMHHLTEPDAARVLREMARVARRCVLVSDLRRCHTGLAAAYLASRLLTRSHVVRVDALLSVRAAFTPDEFRGLSVLAGMPDAAILPAWPFRMLLAWTPT